ncbi:MAG: hypothetical protein NTX48_11840 [Planctomycetales bacterium]|nr:hypothetical protein [Planctomycetales bacterium]
MQNIQNSHKQPIAAYFEFDLPPLPGGCDLANEDVFRLFSRAPRRGFWLTAVAFVVLLAAGIAAVAIGYPLGGVSCVVFAVGAGTANLLLRHKINAEQNRDRDPDYSEAPPTPVGVRVRT